MDMFMYDNRNKILEINTPEVLLIKEFEALLKRDKTKDKSRLFRELTYIYLAIDWKSPYNQYTELERHEEALNDADLSEKEWNDPVFREACRKYRKLQDSNKSVQLLHAALTAVDLLIDYFSTIVDLNERDNNGKPIFSAKKVMEEVSNLHKVHEELTILEKLVKEELTAQSSTKGGVQKGFDPGNF